MAVNDYKLHHVCLAAGLTSVAALAVYLHHLRQTNAGALTAFCHADGCRHNHARHRPKTKADPFSKAPRQGHLSWDDYFMAVAFLSAERSKDPNKQVGACIVNQDNVILGIGYNGFPRGCHDSQLPWSKKSKDSNPLQTKYPYVVHAEANALLNKNSASVSGAKIYVTMFPCNECAKLLIQAGITEVIFHEDKIAIPSSGEDASSSKVDPCYVASSMLLGLAGVGLRQHVLMGPILLGNTPPSGTETDGPCPTVPPGDLPPAGGVKAAAACSPVPLEITEACPTVTLGE